MSSLPFRFARLARQAFAVLVGMSLALPATASIIDYIYTEGRLTGLEYDDGTVVQYSYDSNGNRTATVVIPPVDATPPTVPGNVIAAVSSPTQIGLTWSASSDAVGVTGYELQRCSGAGCSSFSNIGTATATSYSDGGALAEHDLSIPYARL